MNETLRRIVRHKATVPVASAIGGFIFGYGVKAIVDNTRVRRIYPADLLLDQKIAEKEKYADKVNELNYSGVEDPEEVIFDSGSIVLSETGEIESMPDEITPVRKTIEFARSDDGWDYDKEVAARKKLDPSKPYVIHRDEYFSDEYGYMQMPLTYYAMDDVLVDDGNMVVANYKAKVGDMPFGYGSMDVNVVYIRNPKYKAEYEILRHDGAYAHEVLGFDYEDIDDETDRHRTKFRLED